MRLTKQIINRLLARKITEEQALEQFEEIVAKSECPSEWTRASNWVDDLKSEVKFRKENSNLFKKEE